ncbi:MAG: Mur ligase family protein [Methanobacterium sp.]|uniref:Mur ligase family protein n=1 Tax=Methanobacterium sp. TaxID=2164 RepID=UPI003C7394F2
MTNSDNGNLEVYGVIGICGVVSNLVARVLMDHGHQVIGTDLHKKDECDYLYTLNDYNLLLYLSEHPESFFYESNYIVTPPSLMETSNFFKKIKVYGKNILSVEDILESFKPKKPVVCITGTNGKTTTTTLLKHICRQVGLEPTEHGFRNLQGNIDYIPPLQARLNGDVAVLETGTFGKPGDLSIMVERSEPECGVVTNINPDHLDENLDFMSYARIKGEFIEYFKNKILIVNSDDPTIFGMLNPESSVITFGVDSPTAKIGSKTCWCGREIIITETITGSGSYNCECGINRPSPDYLAKDIDEANGNYTLQTPEGDVKVEMQLIGLHNVYNSIGAVAAAREFFKIPLNDILPAIKSFKGVPGRIEHLYDHNGMDVILDYGHNPAGIETVLRELKKVYNKITVVITVSSESGETGDIEILNNAIENGDFIVPASFASRKAAQKLDKYISTGKILFTDISSEEFKKGTLGASSDQVLAGVKTGLKCNTDALVCLGEAAFKYKENILKLKDK